MTMKLYSQNEIISRGGRPFDAGYQFCAFMPDGSIAIPWDTRGGRYFRVISRIRGAVWLKRWAPALFALLPSDVAHCVETRRLTCLQ